MIALDSSTLIRFYDRRGGPLTPRVVALLTSREAALPPVVLTEFLSWPLLSREEADEVRRLPMLELQDGYWRRAGELRAALARAGRRAKLGDTLVAQACIDADVPLLTSDADFRVFADLGGLRLA